MKYWKQFWGGLNQGWKRIHYVGWVVVTVLCLSNLKSGDVSGGDEALFVIALTFAFVPLMYFSFISLVYWIKEGFQSKEPTEEE
ncbi:hypothetical protein OAL15_03800 [Flavobacteriales bacterium]|nr:hypothetical protein [Flavobacteriales bacterium]